MEKHTPNCSIHTHCAVYHADGICNHKTYGKCDCGMEKETPEGFDFVKPDGFEIADKTLENGLAPENNAQRPIYPFYPEHCAKNKPDDDFPSSTPKDWREEFDELFKEKFSLSDDAFQGMYETLHLTKALKTFIERLLAREREETVREVLDAVDDYTVYAQEPHINRLWVLEKIKSISKSV